MQLTPHFSLKEMSKSETAARLGINNTIPSHLIPNATIVAEAGELIRAHFDKPVVVTSCYRCPELNKAVPGSSKTSAHCSALAMDCEIDGVPNKELAEWCAANIPNYDQVIYEFGEAGWVHIGFSKTPRKQTLTATKGDTKTKYLPGIVEV